MLLLLTSVLLFSCACMLALLYARHIELSTGRVLFAGIRPHVGQASERALGFIEGHLPGLARRAFNEMRIWLRVSARASLARMILAAEQALERALEHLRHTTTPTHVAGEASAFLREVAEHKKRLMRRSRVMDARIRAIAVEE